VARLRVDGALTDKPHLAVRIGAVLTFPLGARIRVIKIVALPQRRGPAGEARALYEDLNPRAAQPDATSERR